MSKNEDLLEPCPARCDNGWTEHDSEGVPQKQCDRCRGLGEVFNGSSNEDADRIAVAAVWFLIDDQDVPPSLITQARSFITEVEEYWSDQMVAAAEAQVDYRA